MKLAERVRKNTEQSGLQGKPQDVHEPILIHPGTGIILGGFAEWHVAVCAGQPEIDCVEFELDADEALQLILTLHRPRVAWNDFARTELALEQERHFQAKALANQIAGGKHKVWQICQKLSPLTCEKKLRISLAFVLGLFVP